MTLKNSFKLIIIAIYVVALANCTTTKKHGGASVYEGGSEYGNNVYSSGRDDDASFQEAASFAANNKCTPSRPMGGIEQHYYFDFDSCDVKQEAMASIRNQANYLSAHPNVKIRLEGNTDDRGSREYNIALGWHRAQAVMDLLKQYGARADQIVPVSYGAERPAAQGEDEKSYQCNRRVDLKYNTGL